MSHLPFDVAPPGLAETYNLGIFTSIFLLFIIIVVEALVLRLLRWGPTRRVIGVSALMNIASVIFGVFVANIFINDVWLGLFVSWILSILIEGLVLILLNPGQNRQNWIASLAANTISYIGLVVLVLIMNR